MEMIIYLPGLFITSQGILLSRIIYTMSRAIKSYNYYLILFVLLESLRAYVFLSRYPGSTLPGLPYEWGALFVLSGPMLYLHVVSKVNGNFALCWDELRHFCGFPLVLLAYILGVRLSGPLADATVPPVVALLDAGVWILTLIYGNKTKRLIRLTRLVRGKVLEDAQETHLAITTISLFQVAGISCLFFSLARWLFNPLQEIEIIVNMTLIYLIFQQIYDLVVNHTLYRNEEPAQGDASEPAQTEPAKKRKYAKSGLKDREVEVLWRRIENWFRERKPYLDTGLDLKSLAAQLALNQQLVSQAINAHSQCSFYELVERHRIDHARQLLEDPANGRRKLLDIALSSGYASQSTFFYHFKRRTGCTPQEYRRSHLREESAAVAANFAR